jgi:hypothetical protein
LVIYIAGLIIRGEHSGDGARTGGDCGRVTRNEADRFSDIVGDEA